jgi:hypothetical protein
LTLSSSRRDYSGNISSAFGGEVTLSFDALTLADLGDVIDLIENSPSVVGQAFANSQIILSTYRVDGTDLAGMRVSPREVDRALNVALGAGSRVGLLLEQLQTQRRLSQGIDALSGSPLPDINVRATLVTSQPVTSPPGPAAGSVATARNDWKTQLRNVQSPLKNSTFVIDEPCLQFGLAPVLNDNKLVTGLDLRGRYDFLNAVGALYSKFRLDSQVPLNSISSALVQTTSGSTTPLQRPYFQRLNITNASGYQRKGGDWIISGGSLLSYSSARDQEGADRHEWHAGGRLQIYAPNLTGLLSTTLPGAGTSPIFYIDVAASHGADPKDKKTHLIATGNLAVTVRPSIRASLDLLAKLGRSPADAFGPYSHFAYAQAQFRFNLSSDWDYLIRYSCGRQDPDYHKFCGWQSGITLALGR